MFISVTLCVAGDGLSFDLFIFVSNLTFLVCFSSRCAMMQFNYSRNFCYLFPSGVKVNVLFINNSVTIVTTSRYK